MARIAIIFGCLMMLLGGGLYVAAVAPDTPRLDGEGQPIVETSGVWVRKLTSLIPAAFGVVLLVLGVLASKASDRGRMHIMHAAALIGLIGVGIPAWRVTKALTSVEPINGLAVGGVIAMGVLSAIFLGLCVRSFIQARIERKRKEAEAAGQRN